MAGATALRKEMLEGFSALLASNLNLNHLTHCEVSLTLQLITINFEHSDKNNNLHP